MAPAPTTKVLLGALMGLWLSCYSPSLSSVVYRCASDGSCPTGLTCSDGFCVISPIPACKGGGIVSSDGRVTACPGNSNSCAASFRVCPDTVSSTLCHNISDLVDLGAPGGDGGGGGGGADLAGQVVLTPARCLLCCPAGM